MPAYSLRFWPVIPGLSAFKKQAEPYRLASMLHPNHLLPQLHHHLLPHLFHHWRAIQIRCKQILESDGKIDKAPLTGSECGRLRKS